MNTIEDFKYEHDRICDIMGTKVLTHDAYRYNCRDGYFPHWLKKKLGLTFNQAKKLIGAEIATSHSNRGKVVLSRSIFCIKMGEKTLASQCVPGVSDVCSKCPDRQDSNVGASSDTLSIEEERIMRHTGTYRSSSAYAVEDGYIDYDV